MGMLTIPDLIGRPLSDMEEKIAPKEIFSSSPERMPMPSPRVSIIGSRNASSAGLERARRITKALVGKGAVIISGLAKGIDTAAHEVALEAGGKTVAVLGTPLNTAYPKENHGLQQRLMREQIVISQFPEGHPILPKNFVMRNKTMAVISDASVIVEAGKTSGSRHQGWATINLKRPLFISESVAGDDSLGWPQEMLVHGARILSDPADILEAARSGHMTQEVLPV